MKTALQRATALPQQARFRAIYARHKAHTMIPLDIYLANLALCWRFHHVQGLVVECGTWKGGMIAGIAEVLGPERFYYLFDSFEGLPEAKEIDGDAALKWQADTDSATYFDNCRAAESSARAAMDRAGVEMYRTIPGWFSETLPVTEFEQEIAILRLDADWYESTISCLNELFPKVTPGGLIVVDDYYTWDGCSRAVHDYLSMNGRSERVYQFQDQVCYIVKAGDN